MSLYFFSENGKLKLFDFISTICSVKIWVYDICKSEYCLIYILHGIKTLLELGLYKQDLAAHYSVHQLVQLVKVRLVFMLHACNCASVTLG